MSKFSIDAKKYSRVKDPIEIMEYLEYMGHDVAKFGHGQYQLVAHDSLKITPSKNAFYWFSRGVGGGVFELMTVLDGITAKKDRIKLAREIRAQRGQDFRPRQLELQTATTTFELSEFSFTNDMTASINYLHDVRQINQKIIDTLIKAGLVRQEIRHTHDNQAIRNLWFVWYDEHHSIIGADILGTQARKRGKRGGYFHGIAKGSPSGQAGFHFSIGPQSFPDKLYVFESPIDAISFWQMNEQAFNGQNIGFLSISGVKVHTLANHLQKFYTDNGQYLLPSEIHIAVDNDITGRDFAKRILALLSVSEAFESVKLYLDTPTDVSQKDWNDVLRYGKWGVRQTEMAAVDTVPLYQANNK